MSDKTYRKRILLAHILSLVAGVTAMLLSAAIMAALFYVLIFYTGYVLMAACVVTLVAWLIVRGSSAKVSS